MKRRKERRAARGTKELRDIRYTVST